MTRSGGTSVARAGEMSKATKAQAARANPRSLDKPILDIPTAFRGKSSASYRTESRGPVKKKRPNPARSSVFVTSGETMQLLGVRCRREAGDRQKLITALHLDGELVLLSHRHAQFHRLGFVEGGSLC